MYRKLITCTALALTAGVAAPAFAQDAADYPSKAIRLVIPFPPGGGTDILSRVVANKLTEATNWTVVPENKAGAGGTIGITEAAKAAPTGYEMVMGQKDNLVLGPYLYKSLPWHPVKDLTPVAHVAYTPVIIATSVNSPYKTIADVVAAAKAKPTQITYGSPGNGTSIHIAGHLFEKAADMQEQGIKDFDVSTWYGLFMPAGTPAAITAKMNAEVNKLLAQPAVQEAILAQGAEPKAMSIQEFETMFREDFANSEAVVKASGAVIQ